MKQKIAIALLLIIVLQQYLLSPVYAAIETSNYGWTLGKYNTSTKVFSPLKTTELGWNGLRVRTIGPWSIYNGADGIRQGSVVSFVDKNKPEDNGYPMVCEDDWDKWITYFNGNSTFVKSALDKWDLLTGNRDWKTFANFSQLVELCGGKGLSYSIENMFSNYVRSYPPTISLVASSTAVKVGQPFKLFIKAQSSTYYYQFIDVKLTGAGSTYIDKRYMSNNVNEEKNLYFSYPGQYRFTLQINDGVYRYASREIVINVAENPVNPEQPPAPPPPEPPVIESNQPPVARFSWPATCYEGQEIKVTENSVDYDGKIVKWDWDFSDTTDMNYQLGEGGGTVTFNDEGDRELTLTVTDDKGAYDSVTKTTRVLVPIPTARITYSGTLKENRKVILSSATSRTPSGMIDHSRDFWVITPVSGGLEGDIKLGVKSGSTREVLFKKAGTYKIGLRVSNEKYNSEWVYKDLVIEPDLPPVADFAIPSVVLRNPSDSNLASINLTDKSSSPDDDVITERVWKYRFDSNNNGSFSDETWVTLDTGNNKEPVIKTNRVGKYLVDLDVKESFGQPSIPAFVTDADKRMGNTALKALNQKLVEVQNVAPETYFVPRARPKVDVYIGVGDTIPESKLDDLSAKVESYITSKLLAKNYDTQVYVDDYIISGPNLVLNPGFENDLGSWTNLKSYYTKAVTSPVHSGLKSLIARGSSFTAGTGGVKQLLSGWTPGMTVQLSGYVNVVSNDYNSEISLDLYGTNSSGNVVLDSNFPYQSPTGGWVYFSQTITIPTTCSTLYIRAQEYSPSYNHPTVFFDDLSVRSDSRGTADQLINNSSWRTDAVRCFVSLSDVQLVNPSALTNFKNRLTSDSINYSVLGNSANQAEAKDIISSNGGKGTFINNSNLDNALSEVGDYIASSVPLTNGTTVRYLLLGEGFLSETYYSDYETDTKYTDNWYYVHDPDFVDNNNGFSIYNGKTYNTPQSSFDKYGKYDIYYKAQDDPTTGNGNFANYRLWSDPAPTSIIVHRKPIAGFTVQSGTLYVNDTSYDPDFQYKRPDKGLVEWYWQWKKAGDTNWIIGKPSGITQPGDYQIYLKVKDCYGVWSDPFQQEITVTELNRPPNADFTWTPSSILESDNMALTNLSSDPDSDPLTYQWTVFNPKGITNTYSTKNVSLTDVLPGPYWITLRVSDSDNASDVVTKFFIVNTLGIAGQVKHTGDWDSKRIAYNKSVSGKDNFPRSIDVFWAGEKFILTTDTTDTTPSAVTAQTVTVSMPSTGTVASLACNTEKTWTGSMWQENFINLPDGPLKFIFTGTYSNGAVKTDEVWINISGSVYDYNRYHRAE